MASRRIKVLFTIEEHDAGYYGGAFKDLLTILAHLDRDRFLPEVLLTGDTGVAAAFEPLGVQVLACPLPPWRKGRSYPLVPPALFRVIRLLLRRRPGLVHINSGYNDVPYVSLAARLLQIPSLFTVRDVSVLREKSRKYHFRWANRLVLCAMTMEAEVARQRLIPHDRVRTIYAGIDVEAFRRSAHAAARDVRREFGVSPGAPLVGVVANLSPIKGHEDLFAALALVAPKVEGLRCLCVGGGDATYQRHLERLASECGLERRVVFAGYQQEVAPFYHAMDLVVLPSRSEAFGMALLEAMALSRPVVATTVGGIPEVVIDGVTGLLIPPSNPPRLADAMLRLLNDPPARLDMGLAGLQRAGRDFSLKAQMASLQSLYSELLNGS